jgi:hypothetical protein
MMLLNQQWTTPSTLNIAGIDNIYNPAYGFLTLAQPASALA